MDITFFLCVCERDRERKKPNKEILNYVYCIDIINILILLHIIYYQDKKIINYNNYIF